MRCSGSRRGSKRSARKRRAGDVKGSSCASAENANGRAGFTLIEAVVGTVLIAAFASSTFLAFRMHSQQLQFAADTMQAVEFADGQLESLLSGNGAVKPSGGEVPGHPDWLWAFTIERNMLLAGTPSQVGVLRVIRQSDSRVLVATEVVASATPVRSGGATR